MANQFRVRKGLIVNGSGSTLLDVQGSQGQLFSITDSLSGSLFAAKDISGIPVIEAFSDNRVNIGTFNAEAIKVSGSFAFVTGSLRGTASWAENSRTASLATTASFAVTASYFSGSISNALLADTASFVTASNVYGPFGSNSVLSSSYALTASFALNAGGAVAAVQSFIATASFTASVNTSSFQITSASSNIFNIDNAGQISVGGIGTGPSSVRVYSGNANSITVNRAVAGYSELATFYDASGTNVYLNINAQAQYRIGLDTILARDSANTFAQRNSATSQSFRIYNTYTSLSDFERGKLEWSGSVFNIGTEQSGSGVARALALQTSGSTRLFISASGLVGIGTSAPSFNLDVSGSGRFTNGLQVTGSLNAPVITGSLFGTASWAQNARTASYGINIVISGSVNNADYIQFNTNATVTDAVGRLYYDNGEGTIKIGLSGGNVVANIGEDLYQYVYNNTGAPLTKGQVVYISGSQGNRIAVKLASAVAEQGSAQTLGFVAESIGTGAEGWIQTEGVMRKLNTTGLVGGQLLYLSSSAGQYTQTRPQAPLHEVRLGYAERIDATVGSIYIKIDNGYEIDELHDVRIIDEVTGDLLVRSGSLWINSKQLTGSYGLTGSLTATSFTGSLHGTASWANNAVTASHALTASSADAFTVRNFIELLPGTDPGTANVSASYLFVTSSADNTEQNLHYRNNGALWETHWLEQVTNTGLVWGGILTFTASLTDTPPNSTEMRITPGAGLIINHNANTASHGDTVPTYVQFGPITASATFITSSQVTYLLIDENGQLVQQTTKFTPEQYVEKFPLGYIFCLTTSSISSYADARVTTYGQAEQEGEFVRAFGPLKLSGYDITAQSGSLKISIAAGQSYRYGGFYTQNPQSPSIYDSTAVPTGSLVRVYRDPGVTGGFRAQTNAGLPFTDIDPTKWDDGSGTLQTVGASEWTIQRLFEGVVNNVTYVYYGQNVYSSLALALQSITTDEFVESPTSILALPFIGYIITRGNTTDIGDTANNRIIQAGLFRNTAGSSGGGGAAAQNLNDLADVNIVSATNGQALIYNSGLWVNGDPTTAATASYVLNAVSASFATNAATASYVLQGVSASFASTASYVQQAVSASFASTASFVNPLIQAVQITGSLFASGSRIDLTSTSSISMSAATTIDFTTGLTGASQAYRFFSPNSQAVRLLFKGSDRSVELSPGSNQFGVIGNWSTHFNGPSLVLASTNGNQTVNYFTIANDGVANVMSLRQDAAAQTLRIYNTYTSVANHERGKLEWSGSVFYIGTEQSGSGAARPLALQTSGSTRLFIDESGNISITGSLTSNNTTGSLLGTASWAQNAVTASFITTAQTASYVLQAVSSSFASTASFVSLAQTASFVTTAETASYVQLAQSASYVLQAVSASFASTASFVTLAQTASFVATASWAQNVITASYVTGSVFTSTNPALSASYALTASFALNAGGTTTTFPFTGSAIISGSLQVTGSVGSTGGFTGSLLGTASWAEQAATASFVTLAQTASFVTTAQTASFVTLAQSASYVLQAVSASYATAASYSLATKAGAVANTSFAGNPRKATVTFGSAFPNTSYAITVTGEDSRTWTIESKLVGSFVINANSNTSLAGTTYWIATQYSS